jgi:hypothetical protein
MTHACNLSSREAKLGGSGVPGYIARPYLKKKKKKEKKKKKKTKNSFSSLVRGQSGMEARPGRKQELRED